MLHKMSVVDVVRHYQRSIEKCGDDEKRMLHCINKLCHLPITVQHLKETGVGRTVNALRKYDGQVGEAAKYTVTKWKQMVADEESSEDDVDAAATESYQENVGEDYMRADEEEEPDDEYNNAVIRENSTHTHRESHSKRRKDDNHRLHTSKSEHKVQKEKLQRDADQSKKKYKDRHKYEDINHTEEKQSQKRKSNSSKSNSIEEKRRKYECDNDNVSDDDSESQEMQIDEQVNEDSGGVGGSDEELEEDEGELHQEEEDDDDDDDEEEEEEEEEEKDDSDVNDSDNRGSVSDSSSSRLTAPSHKQHSKHHSRSSVSHHSGSSNVHHSKHHKESHRKHEKHKDKKSSSSDKHSRKGGSDDKHSRKSDSDKVNERTSGSNHKDKHSKHKDDKHEHKRSKDKNSSSVSSSNHSGEAVKEKEHLKHKTVSFVKDSEPQGTDNKKRKKEKTESGEKSSSSSKHQKSSSSKTKDSKDKKKKKVVLDEDEDDDGITSTSGASFAEALGMVDPLIKKKTNTSVSTSNSKAHKNTNSKTSAVAEKSASKNKEMKAPKTIPSVKEEPTLLSSDVKLEPLKVDLDATLPEISPNYRPLPHPNMDAFPQRKTKTMSDEDALALAMSQKNQRTRVYSGMRSGKSWSSVPTLFDICVRVLQEHIDAIEYTGGVPYDLLKPIVTIATPDQLFNLEHYNPYLIEDTDELWEFHCKKSFRNKQREEMETWRDMYIRCVEEREAKLKALTSNIQQSIAKSTPVRQTKLAYVDSVVKPPRNVAKQQAKYGTATTGSANKGTPVKGQKPGASGYNTGAGISASAAPVPVPPPRGVPSVAKVKPRMAPLMQKTMKLVKSFKR